MGLIGTTMNKAAPWNGDEVDMDLRDAARRAARSDGLSLSDWLDDLMERRAQSMGVETADLGAEDWLAAVTDRLGQPHPDRPASFRTADRALAGFEADRQRARNWRADLPKGQTPHSPAASGAGASRGPADAPAMADDIARRRAALRRDVAEGERRFRGTPPTTRDTAAARLAADLSDTQAETFAAMDEVPQRAAIENKLNALFHALERSTNRLGAKRFEAPAADLQDDRGEPTAIALTPRTDDAAPPRAQTLLGSTTLSPSRTLDQAIAEISHRQSILAHPPQDGRSASRAPSPARVAAPPAAVEPGAALFASLQGDLVRVSERLDAIHGDVARHAAAGSARDDAFDEIRSMLDRMRPDQSIESLESRVQDLTTKIDDALQSRAPASAIEQLSQRIEDVHASLSDRLSATAASTIDTGPIEAAVRDLVSNVQTLQQDGTDIAALEALIHKLTNRLDEERDGQVSARQFDALQAQVGKLATRVDRTDEGLGTLVSVERSLGDLFSQLEETRDAAVGAAETAARNAARDALRSAMSEDSLPFAQAQRQTEAAVEQVTQEIADLRAVHETADKRLNAILGALNMTLEKVVDRLGALETEPGDHAPSRPAAIAKAPAPARAPDPAPVPVVAPAPVAAHRVGETFGESVAEAVVAANPLNAARRARPVANPEPVAIAAPRRGQQRTTSTPAPVASPVGEDVDFLIEPGATPARRQPGRAPEVQAAPAASQQTVSSDPTNFIAAARRAAQSAAQASAQDLARTSAAAMAKARGDTAPEAPSGPRLVSRAARFLSARRRPLLLALAGLVMLIGAVEVARMSLRSSGPATVVEGNAESPTAAPQVASDIQGMAPGAGPATTDANVTASGAGEPGIAPAPAVSSTASDAGAATAPITPIKPLPSLAMAMPTGATAAKAPATHGVSAGLRNMAEDGSAAAQYEVALRLADGQDVTRDLKAAAEWFEKAAKQGLAPAAYRLGSLYEKGMGVPRDAALAMQWYQAAADKGNVRAMHNLAVMSAEGSGGKSDYAKAATWFTKAAQAGVRDSQFNLAILYARGLGIEQSLPQSYTWFAIAAAQGDADAATKRDEVAGRLDAKALADAKKNADNFQPAPNLAAANDVTAPPGGWDAIAPRPTTSPTSSLKANGKAKVSSM